MKRADDDDTLDLLLQKLGALRLHGMVQLLPALLDKAGKDNLASLDVVHRLCDDERAHRMKGAVDRRVKAADGTRTRCPVPPSRHVGASARYARDA